MPSVPAPQALSTLRGQDRAAARLTDAVRSGRIHHAWTFHGPSGVGKFTAALAFASLLLDPTTQETFGGTFEADPQSATQRLLAAGNHPDLRVIVKELARFHSESRIRDQKQRVIPVEVLREFMLDPGSQAPTLRTKSRAGRVFIVDGAESMAAPAQNAILKFFEEPPPRTVVILVTSNPERLLPTIRSRCQRVYFPPLSRDEMRSWLRDSGLNVPASEQEWLIEFADGSPGMLAGAVSGGLMEWRARLHASLEQAAAGKFDPALGTLMDELVGAHAEEAVKVNKNASKEAANHAAAEWMLRFVASYARRLVNSGGAREVGAAWVDALRESEPEIHSNVNQMFVFEKLAAGLAAANPAR